MRCFHILRSINIFHFFFHSISKSRKIKPCNNSSFLKCAWQNQNSPLDSDTVVLIQLHFDQASNKKITNKLKREKLL